MGADRDHRRDWVLKELEGLLANFAIDLHAYAVMSNHLHLVLRPRPDVVSRWSNEQIVRAGLACMPRWINGMKERLPVTKDTIEAHGKNPEWVEDFRERLSSLSWFMRLLKQHVATRANHEDRCTGHFWESRFKVVPLLDYSAVLACMVYVDLNPFRSGMAKRFDHVQCSSLRSHLGLGPGRRDEAVDKFLTGLNDCRPLETYGDAPVTTQMNVALYRDLVLRACGRPAEGDVDRFFECVGLDADAWSERMSQPGLFQSGAVGGQAARGAYALAVGRKWINDKTRVWTRPE